jgi:hypothetical protein
MHVHISVPRRTIHDTLVVDLMRLENESPVSCLYWNVTASNVVRAQRTTLWRSNGCGRDADVTHHLSSLAPAAPPPFATVPGPTGTGGHPGLICRVPRRRDTGHAQEQERRRRRAALVPFRTATARGAVASRSGQQAPCRGVLRVRPRSSKLSWAATYWSQQREVGQLSSGSLGAAAADHEDSASPPFTTRAGTGVRRAGLRHLAYGRKGTRGGEARMHGQGWVFPLPHHRTIPTTRGGGCRRRRAP